MARKQIPSGLKGSGCLSVPFFTEDDKVNVAEMKRYVKWLIEKGTRTIVPGSVCPGCTRQEARVIWKSTREAAEGKATVMPYLGPRCNTTALFLEDIKPAEDIGCDALYFSVQTTTNATGYYETPAFLDQLVDPWRAGLEATSLPVMLYNHSGLSYSREPNLPVDILVEISREYENVAGIKTNSPLAGQLAAEIQALKPLGLSIAKGLHEMEFVGSLAMGVDGFISITGQALSITLRDNIPFAHKFSLKAIAVGEPVVETVCKQYPKLEPMIVDDARIAYSDYSAEVTFLSPIPWTQKPKAEVCQFEAAVTKGWLPPDLETVFPVIPEMRRRAKEVEQHLFQNRGWIVKEDPITRIRWLEEAY